MKKVPRVLRYQKEFAKLEIINQMNYLQFHLQELQKELTQETDNPLGIKHSALFISTCSQKLVDAADRVLNLKQY